MDNLQQFTTLLRRKLYIVVGGIGVLLMAIALVINYIKTPPVEQKAVFTQPGMAQKVKVDIEGAVEQPGIYEVANDSRIQDVLITAGGMTPKANRTYVSQNINLAQKVYDGLKIYIPENISNLSNSSNLTNLSNLVNINTGTLSQLDTLPGIGEATAKKIIDGRPYQNTSQLVEMHIVTQSVFTKIKDLISL
jgi:competence protein ComEA